LIALETKHTDCSQTEGDLRMTLKILNSQLIGIKENEKDYITKINTLNALNKELEAWKVEHLDTDVKNKLEFTTQYELIKK
jgi:hypothetical protein